MRLGALAMVHRLALHRVVLGVAHILEHLEIALVAVVVERKLCDAQLLGLLVAAAQHTRELGDDLERQLAHLQRVGRTLRCQLVQVRVREHLHEAREDLVHGVLAEWPVLRDNDGCIKLLFGLHTALDVAQRGARNHAERGLRGCRPLAWEQRDGLRQQREALAALRALGVHLSGRRQRDRLVLAPARLFGGGQAARQADERLTEAILGVVAQRTQRVGTRHAEARELRRKRPLRRGAQRHGLTQPGREGVAGKGRAHALGVGGPECALVPVPRHGAHQKLLARLAHAPEHGNQALT